MVGVIENPRTGNDRATSSSQCWCSHDRQHNNCKHPAA